MYSFCQGLEVLSWDYRFHSDCDCIYSHTQILSTMSTHSAPHIDITLILVELTYYNTKKLFWLKGSKWTMRVCRQIWKASYLTRILKDV